MPSEEVPESTPEGTTDGPTSVLPNRVMGMVEGVGLNAADAFYTNSFGPQQMGWAIALTSFTQACSLTSQSTPPIPSTILNMLAGPSGNLTPGTYDVRAPSSAIQGSIIVGYQWDDGQGNKGQATATGGTVTVNSVNNMKTEGTFSVDFPNGDKLTGSFNADFCQIMSPPSPPAPPPPPPPPAP